ncbi:MAG: UDP-N-acetylmuramoyl-tripeptide--D-alanyl-D-alanine ligase [Neisseriaceae bacterium]|nr:UDP-N-acetylmuramoyl-tripeptide--D-alanyl-D-alanine ligase [Neisseriaceae bacterium]
MGEGDLFVALKGERFDAHEFVVDALNKGAVLAIVRDDFLSNDPRVIRVPDTLAALGQLAKAWRDQLEIKVVGITGSSGKTTVKEMMASIARVGFGKAAVLATQGNLNNDIGLPLTLLQLTAAHKVAIIEMGMNHFGELTYLTHLARPDVALVNNALRAHVGCGFDGVADIARAKSEIYAGLQADGLALIPCEDANAATFVDATQSKKTQTFGLHQGDVHAENIVLAPLSSRFDLVAAAGRQAVTLPTAGAHNVYNAVAAASMALALGLSLQNIAQGLAQFSNISGRLQVKSAPNGARVLDDTYNANPDSMKAALSVLAQFEAPRFFVMGDMGELGEGAEALHVEVGLFAQSVGIEVFYALGAMSQAAVTAFGSGAEHFASVEELILALQQNVPADATVLVKGSRFMKMERVVQALVDNQSR